MKCVEELSGKIDLSITKKFQDVKKGFTFFQDEDIIFAKITPCMENGKIAITRGLKNGIGFGSTEYHVVRLYPEFSREFYFHYLISEEFRKKAKTQMKGTAGQLRVSTDYLQNVMVPVPPLNEQKRIVAKIEELFSLVDSAKENLEKTKILLKQYRQSILKHAFEGKLVPQDPNDEPASVLLEKIKKENPNFQESEILFDIPNNWMWIRIDNICSKINDGTHYSPHNDSHGEIPYITAKNIRPNKIDMTNITYVSKKIHDEIYSRCNPVRGDILYTKDGTIGYSAVNEFDFEFSLLSSVSLIKPTKNLVVPYFLSHYLNSPANYYRLTGKITGTALRRIILQRIKEIPVPLCPLNEQKRIVAKIEESFSIIEKNEKLVDSLLLQYSQIKNSILKQAFEGKLVPQDPNDEPAQILLERIQQERKKNGK